MNGRHTDPARIVFDPAIPSWKLRALRAADWARATVTAPSRHLPHTTDRIVAAYLLAASGAGATQLAMPGDPWAWAWFLAATALLASVTAATARAAKLRCSGRYVNPARMDPGSRQVLARAQAAISDVLGAQVCRDGFLDAPVSAAVLGAREWEVARMLDEACRLATARADLLGEGPAGPAPGPQQEVLRQVRAAALQRAENLEDFARQVMAADIAYRQHAAAGPLASLDGSFLDLMAAAAAGYHAREEVRRLHAEAATAEQVLRAS
jgi:hypothetical protein